MSTIDVFSGIQPSGELHLGNYFGAVANWVRLQGEKPGRCMFGVVDLHAITAPYEAKVLRENTMLMLVDLLAVGVDPAKSTLILQSLVPEHTELCWLFAGITPHAWLAKMTQFKDKSRQVEESGASFSGGLFVYPLLMAADILIYKAHGVPVGEDQDQHLELARDIARTFNARFGETFPDPQPLHTKTPKILSLADPTKKMSKSLGPKHYVGVFEDPTSIRKKVMSAVTDTGETAEGTLSPGVEGLLTLLSAAGKPERAAELRAGYLGGAPRRYAPLKEEVAETLLAYVAPFRPRRAELLAKKQQVIDQVMEMTCAARAIAASTLQETRQKMGFPPVHARRDASWKPPPRPPKLMRVAREEAHRLGHDVIRPEHLLLACAVEETGTARDLLRRLGVDPATVRREVESRVHPGVPFEPRPLPVTVDVKRCLEDSLGLAAEVGAGVPEGAHLLLALTRLREGCAAESLRTCGITEHAVRLHLNLPDSGNR